MYNVRRMCRDSYEIYRTVPLSRRSRQRERLYATGLYTTVHLLYVNLSVRLSPKCVQKPIFLQTQQSTAMISIDDQWEVLHEILVAIMNKNNLAIANRSRVSCAHVHTSGAFPIYSLSIVNGAILYRLRDIASYWSKIAKFLYTTCI